MNKKFWLRFSILVLVSIFLAGCATDSSLPISATITYSAKNDDSRYTGGYTARFYGSTNSQYYNWVDDDFKFLKALNDKCVTVGSRTETIDLSARYDYEWVKKEGTHDYCLQQKKDQ